MYTAQPLHCSRRTGQARDVRGCMLRTMAGLLILGASRGLGDAYACGVPEPGDRLWLVARSRPASLDRDDGVTRHWIEADLSKAGAATVVARELAGHALDALLYNAGLWEQQGFTPQYDYAAVPEAETRNIMAVNLTAAITCIQALLPNLRQAAHAKVILTGSTSGRDNNGGREVAYTASKFGLRGLAHALRENLRDAGIAVTVINPGDISAEIPWETGLAHTLELNGGRRLPVHDLVALVRCVLALSPASCVKEIDIPALADQGV
jgi:short-subunit dehydrogenase